MWCFFNKETDCIILQLSADHEAYLWRGIVMTDGIKTHVSNKQTSSVFKTSNVICFETYVRV